MESLADRIENRWKGKNKKSKKARANAANMRTKANRIKNKRRIA